MREDLRIRTTLRQSDAFNKLCEKCDEAALGSLFTLLTHSPDVNLGDHKISLRRMDSSTKPKGRFERRQIKALQKKISKLASDMTALNETDLGRRILDTQVAELAKLTTTGLQAEAAEDLRGLPVLLNQYATEFVPLVLEGYKNLGPQQHPDSDRLLRKICEHVKERHGTYHDELVSSVLDDLGFHQFQTIESYKPTALKQWRYRQGLTDREKA